MTATRHSRTFRRTLLTVVVLVVALNAYGSAFVGAAFLYGAGLLSSPAYTLLCDTAFAPLFLLDGDGRLEWLFNAAGDVYWCGFSLIR